jgi:23S rRNA (guanine2445-N2)-methyltransferase / 23S rRNA (guanine2069-N7)-methyltransferase
LSQFNLIVACAFGLEAVVRREIEQLDLRATVRQPGRLAVLGDWDSVARLNLWLRTADRVLIEAGRFPAADFEQLFETTKAIDWSKWLPQDAQFPVNGKSRNSQLTSVPAVQRAVKRAIVDSLTASYQADLPETGALYRLEIALLNDEATLTIDTTGSSLHKRGYRQLVAAAPLKETLAAAMIQLSVWDASRPLIDPFCGSGTIPIEAALIGLNIAPGLQREFSFQHWPNVPDNLLNTARASARGAQKQLELQIQGTDIDADVLSLARHHAELAGVAGQIHFQQKPFETLRSKQEFGCLITNPPYGERLEDEESLLPLYESIPQVLQRLPTWSHFFLTSLSGFERVVQKTATRRRKLYNGRIECTYYQYLGPHPRSAHHDFTESQLENETAQASEPDEDAAPTPDSDLESVASRPNVKPAITAKFRQAASGAVFGGLNDKDKQQAQLFASRLKKRAHHLRRWPTKRGISCYRLYERDIPELPLVVDRYDDFLHITEYERPHDRDLARHAAWLELMKKTAAETLQIPIQHVALKSRARLSQKEQYQKLNESNRLITVQEAGLKFLVNLHDYVDTGLFLDHRQTRAMVSAEAKDRRFLNLFAYTGSFTVYAAHASAQSTVTVDSSNTYLDWTRKNLNANGLQGPQHTLVCEDAITFLQNLHGSDLFDLVVVDPPTYSNSKSFERDWDVQHMHADLLQLLAARLAKGAVVYFSTNFRRFKLAEAAVGSLYDVREISKQTVPEDFRNRRIHRCWRLIRNQQTAVSS